MKTFVLLMSLALLAPVAVAHHSDDHGDEGVVPDMPDESVFGLCTAYAANEKGRENGNAGNAGPFRWLAQQAEDADQTVEEYCAENGQHPGGV